ncbi:MAG: DUF2541 family protein [Hyphomicrobiales bacterium]|nr:DUF2541 family protein [Hyphomicrobiales bacterium]
MFGKLFGAVVALVAMAAVTSANAQERWVLMGSKAVNTRAESDTIDLTAAKGSFKAVRVEARQRGLELSNVEVVYSAGAAHNERRAIVLKQGERTRPIDPRDSGKFVDRVNLTFKAQGANAQPTVIQVFGLQTSAMAAATRPAATVAAPARSPVIPGQPTPDKPSTARLGEQVEGGDVMFGSAVVNFGVDRDVIRVGADIGKFDRIRLRVLDNDIFITDMKVVYADGTSEDAVINSEVKRNTRTRWINLKGDRFIREVQFIYRSKPSFRGRAYVEVYGNYAAGWLGPNGEGRKYNQGWVLLGSQSAGFGIDRNDIITVGRNEGGFKRFEVRVRDEAITLFDVRVVYGNGELDVIQANRARVEARSKWGPVDLKGGTRVIQEIRPTYRTRIFQEGGIARGRSVVEFWGQH